MATLCGCLCANAQDSPLTLWCYDIHTVNPAMAGSANQLRLNTFYRNQWHKTDAGFQYYGASADMPVAKNMGCGIGFSNDHTAAFAKPCIYGSYCYTVKTGRQSEVRLGITPATISPFVVYKIGNAAARELMLTGRRFTADEAKTFHLVNVVVTEDRLIDTERQYIEHFMHASPDAVAECKQLLRLVSGTGDTYDPVFYQTANLLADQRISKAGQEGMAAFFEKRKPEWD